MMKRVPRLFCAVLVATLMVETDGLETTSVPSEGDAGHEGQSENIVVSSSHNLKQCAWNRINDGRESGIIKECEFNKRSATSALRVLWNGNIRVTSTSSSACDRWYFTFNGQECSNPLPIDSAVYSSSGKNRHRVTSIEGLCFDLPAGHIRVEFRVSPCDGYSAGDAYTGWNSVSRIVIEEICDD